MRGIISFFTDVFFCEQSNMYYTLSVRNFKETVHRDAITFHASSAIT